MIGDVSSDKFYFINDTMDLPLCVLSNSGNTKTIRVVITMHTMFLVPKGMEISTSDIRSNNHYACVYCTCVVDCMDKIVSGNHASLWACGLKYNL